MGDWSNKGRNKKVPGIQWKWKYNLPESVNKAKAVLKGKFIALSAYIKKKTRDFSNKWSSDMP
jgi:hypothetical protein